MSPMSFCCCKVVTFDKTLMMPPASVLTVSNGSQCSPEVCEESLGKGRSQPEVVGKQLGQEDRGETEGKSYVSFSHYQHIGKINMCTYN